MKITLDVYLPASGCCYEVEADSEMPFSSLTGLVAQAVGRLAGELYHADDTAILCDRQSGSIFDINMTPGRLGLKNGSAVMLI